MCEVPNMLTGCVSYSTLLCDETAHSKTSTPEFTMPIYPNGFVAGTKVMTSRGPVNIEDVKPGDMIQVQPDDDQGDGKPDAHEGE